MLHSWCRDRDLAIVALNVFVETSIMSGTVQLMKDVQRLFLLIGAWFQMPIAPGEVFQPCHGFAWPHGS